jgi:hypothetical protein
MSRPALTLALLLAAPAALACRAPARALAGGPAGSEGPRALVEALAGRFGPIEREPAFDALRPRLARAALVPSRVFDDPTAWTSRSEAWRAVEFSGDDAGGVYRIGVRSHAPSPAAPGAYRGRVRLDRVSGGRFEWSVEEELAVGPVRPSDLAATLEGLLRGAEASSEAAARVAIAEAFPRSSTRLGLVLRLEALSLRRDAHGATAVRLAVRLTPEGVQREAPRYAAFLRKYATPIRMRLLVADSSGTAWWSLEGRENLWTLLLRVREGSLVPLEGPADRRVPPLLRATIDYKTRMGRFEVGASRLVGDVALTRTGVEKGFEARFLTAPDWHLPFLVEPLLQGPLRFPFEAPGSEAGWAARETPEGGTRLVRHYRARVRETWILRWLGGMTSSAVDEFRSGAEAEADRFNRECLLTLRDDLAALVPFAVTAAGAAPGLSPRR